MLSFVNRRHINAQKINVRFLNPTLLPFLPRHDRTPSIHFQSFYLREYPWYHRQ